MSFSYALQCVLGGVKMPLALCSAVCIMGHETSIFISQQCVLGGVQHAIFIM